MTGNENNLLTFAGKWNIDLVGASIYDIVYDKSLAENAVIDNMLKQIKRGY